MRYPIKLLVLIIIISLSSLSVVQAQLLIAPVIIIEKDVLFRWTLDEGLVEVAPLPDEYERVLISPTSDLALIITQTPEALQTIEEECPCGGAYWPTNFTAVDMLTGEIIEVAPQEAGIPTIEQIQRSLPVFSPDGTQLAWMAGSEVSSLVIYDFATGETQTIAEEIQSQTRVSQPAAITAWTSAGIFVEQVDFDAVGDLHDGFAVYSSDGERLVDTLPLETLLPNSTYFIPSVPPVHYFHRNNGYFIADYQDSSVIVSESELYNLADDSVTSLGGGTVYLTAATYPDADSAIYMSPPIIRDDGKRIFDIYQNGQVIQNSTSLPLLSPGGNAAIIDFGLAEGGGVQFTLWQAESDVTDLVILDMFPDFIDWGGYAYRWEPGDTPLNLIGTCEGQNLPFNLREGARGHVLVDASGSPNNVRTIPERAGQIEGEVAAGDWFDVMMGPECHDGIAWWMIDHPNVQGWMAAGVNDTYFVAPGCGGPTCGRG